MKSDLSGSLFPFGLFPAKRAESFEGRHQPEVSANPAACIFDGVLGAESCKIELDLADWFRFDRPVARISSI
jgi:hypothetical protein